MIASAAPLALPAASLATSAPYDLLVVYLLVMSRIMAFLLIAPPFAGRLLPGRIRGGLAAAMAIPVTPVVANVPHFADMYSLVAALAYHLLTGATLGFMVFLLYSAMQAAGDLVDVFSMFTMSQILDPLSNTNSGVFGRIQNLVATTLLFASGGHLVMFRGLLGSFQAAPVHPPALGEVSDHLVKDFGTFLVSAIEISGPIVVVLVLSDLALGLVSRAVPSLNIFQLAFPVKTVLTVALASLAVSVLPAASSSILDKAMTEMPTLTRLLGG